MTDTPHATSICVLGMHRSGTSSITGALDALGVYLGPGPHMMKRRADNPEGFFEHQLLTDLNDEILRRLGGSWHEPPHHTTGWEDDPALHDLRETATRILREDFGNVPLWGWKDPRTCLTLPFWRPLLPATRYVVCLRNPVDIARSLQVRDGFPLEKGVDLWVRHITAAIGHAGGSPILFVDYDEFVDRQDVEVGRLAAFVGRTTPHAGDASERPRELAARALRHHRTSLADLFASADASHAASTLYTALKTLAALQRADALRADEFKSVSMLLARHAHGAHVSERRNGTSSTSIADEALRRRSAEIEELKRKLDATRAETRAAVGAEQAARTAAQLSAEHQRADAMAARAQLETARRRADEELARLGLEISRLNDLLQHLETPVGILKLALRAVLPPSVHAAVRPAARIWLRDQPDV